MTGDPNNSRIFPISVGDAIVDANFARVAWGPSLITYAFPDSAADYNPTLYDPGSAFNETSTHSQFSAAQQTFALNIFDKIEDITNVSFALGTDTSANMRLSNANPGNTFLGWTYHAFPNEIQGGDVWISNQHAGYANPTLGTAHGLVLMHEILHSLGLDHPWANTHDTTNVQDTIGIKYDGFEYTVMSYHGYTKTNAYGAWNEVGTTSFPQSLMMNDIYTLQYLYGADRSYNSGNNVYTWSSTQSKIFETIWDGGGIDTYDLSNYTSSVSLDLRPGESSGFASSQLAALGDGVSAKGNVYNALVFGGDLSSLIENAVGGSAADNFVGNQLNNTLTGNQGADIFEGYAGNDTLVGNGGLDVLNGGQGNDTLSGGIGSSNQDTFLFRGTSLGNDTITDWQNGVDYIRFENAAATSFSQLGFTQSGTSVNINVGGETITVLNATVSQFTASDFLF